MILLREVVRPFTIFVVISRLSCPCLRSCWEKLGANPFAQTGKKHPHTKVLSGMGNANVIEIRENDISGTYRLIYTIEIEEHIFVLHAFQKKSKSGIATPKKELELIKNRLKEAKALYQAIKSEKKK